MGSCNTLNNSGNTALLQFGKCRKNERNIIFYEDFNTLNLI